MEVHPVPEPAGQVTTTQPQLQDNEKDAPDVQMDDGSESQNPTQGDAESEDEANGNGHLSGSEEADDLQLQREIEAQLADEQQQDKDQQQPENVDNAQAPATASAGGPDAAAHPPATPAPASGGQQQQETPQTGSPAVSTTSPAGAPASAAAADSGLNLVPPELDRFSLFDVPSNIARVRQLLFELREPVEMSLDEFVVYWPYIDNIWVKHRPQSTRSGNYVTDYYMCRLRRPTCRSKKKETPLAEGKKSRTKSVREGGTCNVQMKIVKFEGAVTTITISRTPNSSPTHSHDLDHMDDVKRNSGLMNVIWKEAEKAYLPASIFAKFREHYQRLADLGGKFMRASDVRNVCAKWRAMHPTVPLRTHAGYQHAHGLGVMKLGEQRAISAVGHGMMGMSTMPMGPMQPPLPGPRTLAPGALPFPNFPLDFLESYMPRDTGYRPYPHVTLTYASSMDAKVSLMPGIQTALSCHESKLMTHYLRSRHDAVLIGLRTALADDPGLNCRLDGAGGYGGLGRMWQPRPVIVDPTGKWPVNPESRMMKIAKEGRGKAPWVVVSPGAVVSPDKLTLLKSYGGDFLRIVDYNAFWRLRWEAILAALAAEGVRSVMIEGGAAVISELLNPEYTDFIDSLIVTVAPTFLGKKGLGVAPDSKYDENGKPKTAMSPREVRWQPLGQDVIMCGKMRNPPPPQPRPPVQPTVSEAPAPAILEGIEAVARSADR